MSFRLIVTPPKDDEYTVPTPVEERDALRVHVLGELALHGVRHRSGGMAFAEMVSTADVGAVVTHGDSGYSFRIEEV